MQHYDYHMDKTRALWPHLGHARSPARTFRKAQMRLWREHIVDFQLHLALVDELMSTSVCGPMNISPFE